MKIDLAKVGTAVLTAFVIGMMTYVGATIRDLEIETELIKVRLEQVEKKVKNKVKRK